MERKIVLVVFVGVLAVTAGCIETRQNNELPNQISSDNVNSTVSTYVNTSSFTWEVNEGSESTVLKYDGERSRLLVEEGQGVSGVEETYVNETGSFVKQVDGEVRKGNFGSVEQVADSLQSEGLVRSQFELANATLERDGTTTFKGRTVGVYRASGEQARNILAEGFGRAFDEYSNSSVITVYADTEGHVVYQEYSDASSDSEDVSYALYGFGNTTVEEPDWIDRFEPPAPEPNSIVFFDESNETLGVTVASAGNVDSLRVEYQGQVMTTVDGESAVLREPEDGEAVVVQLETADYSVLDTGGRVEVFGVTTREDGSGAREEVVDRYYVSPS